MDARRYYREGTVTGASPVELVVRLYEQIVEDLRQAARAVEQKNIELRTAKINHAILVLSHLESHLNFADGGAVAQNLRNFYSTVRAKLVQAQFLQSKGILGQQITDLLTVREAWIAVDQASNPPTQSRANADTTNAPPAPRASSKRRDWNG
jgi:flagellar secretion chaperone FliS